MTRCGTRVRRTVYNDWHRAPGDAGHLRRVSTPRHYGARDESIGGADQRCADALVAGVPWAMHDFRRLHVWQLARELAVELDAVTRRFRRVDRGVRRAALSIPANIAEGCGKGSRKETIASSRLPRVRPARPNITC
jgi:hypothetical protein